MIDAFEKSVSELVPRVPKDQRPQAEALVDGGRKILSTLSEWNRETVDSQLRDIVGQIAGYTEIATEAATVSFLASRIGLGPVSLTEVARRLQPLPGLPAVVEAVRVGAAILGVVVVLMLLATLAALSANYAPDEDFGTAWDYLALALSVTASSSIAGVVAAALLVRAPGRWRG